MHENFKDCYKLNVIRSLTVKELIIKISTSGAVCPNQVLFISLFKADIKIRGQYAKGNKGGS
jgi:hypothetical protein